MKESIPWNISENFCCLQFTGIHFESTKTNPLGLLITAEVFFWNPSPKACFYNLRLRELMMSFPQEFYEKHDYSEKQNTKMNSSNFDRQKIPKKKSPKLLNRKMGEIVQDFLRGVKFANLHLVFSHLSRLGGVNHSRHRGMVTPRLGGLDFWWTFKLNGDFLCLNDSGSLILSMLM